MLVFIDNKQIQVTNFVTYLVYLIDKDSALLLTTKFVIEFLRWKSYCQSLNLVLAILAAKFSVSCVDGRDLIALEALNRIIEGIITGKATNLAAKDAVLVSGFLADSG